MLAIDKYFGLSFFLGLNILIIALAQTVGGGTFFFRTGAIHIIALGFVVFALARVFYHYYTYDRILEKFIHACLIAMAVFAISHIVEFASFVVFHQYTDTVYTNVANFYLSSLLLIAVGAESFLHVLRGDSARMVYALGSLVFALAIFSVVLFTHSDLVSLDPDSMTPMLYTVGTLAVVGLNIRNIRQIRKRVDFMRGFIDYLTASVVLIGIATILAVQYELLVDALGIPDYQAVYFSHYAFYASLSFLFLAFGKVSHLGGMLEEVKNMGIKK